ncbi:MAG: ABC transporter permease subunit [Puniceicoccaceae bacterium]|nr:MAG: ABC transporter permease subunit [Puniceicoccaceae bacterium]
MKPKPRRQQPPIAERFRVSPATLFADRLMTGLIMVGGISIIIAVFFIFVFIGFKVAPLFKGAEVGEALVLEVPDKPFVGFGIDEWKEVPYFLDEDGGLVFVDLESPDKHHESRGVFTLPYDTPPDFEIASFTHDALRDRVIFASIDGRVLVHEIHYEPTFPGGRGVRMIQPSIESLPVIELGEDGRPLDHVSYARAQARRLLAAVEETETGPVVRIATLTQRRTPFGLGPLQIGQRYTLREELRDRPSDLLVPDAADSVLVAYPSGQVDYFEIDAGGTLNHIQTFVPFPEPADHDKPGSATPIKRMEFVLGDQTVIFFDAAGRHVGWNLAYLEEEARRRYIPSKEFRPLPGPPDTFSVSRRNKTFLTTAGDHARLTLMTTEAVRWEAALGFPVRQALIAPRFNALLFLDSTGNLHLKPMKDEHPIAGFRTYFTRIQYEGRPGRIYDWQSDGGADFERKLSMVPLIIGTLKGTVYAMFIAVPVALLSAIYVSQFLRPSLKKVVKPTMEIMASLPSVILGFFAGMWLSPLISNAVPSVMMSTFGVFLGAILMGLVWSRLPNRIRLSVPSGMEFVFVFVPAMFVAWLGWHLGQVVENWMFLQYDELLEREVGSFRMWVVNVLGWDFETRNALVVGFAMGFAVIPIIFTISEDSMSNVPNAFRSGSLALGASRWQTAIRIVLPTAAAGIFSALMIGFGRAIGETMIMVMATGNSVVQDFNPFTGMRTLSANIAVEISEAEQNGTLYRTLFLCAFILFVFTFTLNTIAEILRQWLRRRYRAVE